MGGKRGGRGSGKDSGGYEDQYGGGWSGGHKDHGGGGSGGGGGGGGGGTGGGSAGGGAKGKGVTYERQLPKFLQQHAHLLQREGAQDDSKKAWEDYGHSDELAKYGDEDDIAGNARKGLGSMPNPGMNQQHGGAGNEVEERERKQEMAKVEKGKGNRAFSEKRYEDAIRSFTRCIELDHDDKVFYSNRSAAHAALKDFDEALEDGHAAVRLAKDWVKGHIRVGAASMGLKRYTDARESYERALKLDGDNDQIKTSLKEAADAEEQSIKSGTIVFAAKRKREDEGKRGSAVAVGKKVKNKTLLSFNEEEDE